MGHEHKEQSSYQVFFKVTYIGIFLCCLGLIILFCGYYRYLHPDNHPREYQYIYYNPDGDSSDKLYTMPGPEMMFWGIAFLFTGALIWYKFRKR